MSDNADRWKEYRFGPDAPEWGPAFWDGYEDFVNPFDTFAEAWDQFRGMSYTDLQALHDRLKERANNARRKRNEVAAEVTSGDGKTKYVEKIEHPEIRSLSNSNTYFWQRANAAAALARYIEELGPAPPWDKLSRGAQNEAQKPVDKYPRRIWALSKTVPGGSVTEWIENAQGEEGLPLTVQPESVQRDLRDELNDRYTFDRLDVTTLETLVHREAKRMGFRQSEKVEKVE